MSSFLDLMDAVGAYYGTGSDQWNIIAQQGINSPEALQIISQVPGVNVTVSNSGKILGYDFANTFPNSTPASSIIDSNTQTGAYNNSFSSNIPANAVAPTTELPNGGMNSGAVLTNSGVTLASVADKVNLAVAGVALGTKLGKMIDAGIYAINPNWFDQHMPTINPETWDDMASTEAGKNVIRAIFGLQNDSATMYIDERLLAQMYMVLKANGAYDSGGYTFPDYTNTGDVEITSVMSASEMWEYTKSQYIALQALAGNSVVIAPDFETAIQNLISSYPNGTPFGQYNYATTGSGQGGCTLDITTTTIGNVGDTITLGGNKTARRVRPKYTISNNVVTITSLGNGNNSITLFIGEKETSTNTSLSPFNVSESEPIQGISDNPNASTYINPSLINGETLDDVLNQLKTYYPELFTDSIYTDVPQPDGTITHQTYIPVPYPDNTNTSQPTTDNTPNINPQTQPQVNPNTRPEGAQDVATELMTPTNNAPDTGDGDTPPAVIPTGTANALYSIYNPTQGELNSFGAWLWSSNFVDQLLKLFNDPMQAIIGLHKVFAPPVISGTSTIKVGYLDSGVSSNVVGNQYITIDCGSVDVSEYFGNVFDYDPFTQIYIYLPFVGIEKLDTGDVMRGRVGVKYHVDVITGACLAEISVTRDSAGGILYTFAGNCAVQYPISSGSYMGIVASLASIAGGVVGTVASGGALAPVAMGAVSGVLNAHTRVQHSGAFSGNAGAMGVKIPYLIITRPQTCLADNFPAFDGYPANKTTTISACSGFVKCKTCHIENIPATDAELSEIEMLLKGGIII